ncbi:MAG: Ig domain-containing protein, partial [Ruminococcus sp.]
ENYKDNIINAILNNEDFWTKDWYDYGVYGYGTIEFMDLNFDGDLEFVVSHPCDSTRNISRIVYYYSDGNLCKAGGGDKATKISGFSCQGLSAAKGMIGYYDQTNNTYKLKTSSFYMDSQTDWIKGNYILTFDGKNLNVDYFSGEKMYYDADTMKNPVRTHYDGAYAWGDLGTAKQISEDEYNQINENIINNCFNIKIKSKSISSDIWKDYSYSQKKKALEESYKGFSYIRCAASVELDRSTLTLGVREKYQLTMNVSPSNVENSCIWLTSDSSVASVDDNGMVTANKSGSANITVRTPNKLTATCKVTVKSAPSSVKIDPSNLTLGVGETYTVSENTSSGSYANAANLKWSTSDSNVATVTKGSGNKATITAKNTGTAYINITLYNGKTSQCKVTVKNAPTSVKTNPTSVTLGKGETYTISENTNSGTYANAANLKWSTTNSSVATVTKGSGNKATITAKGNGTAYIKITLYNGKTAQCKVTVKNAPTSVKTNLTSVTLGTGETYTISESTNSGTYANAANLKWSSSNTSVATVTKGSGNKAVITAKGVGTAYIKITLYNGKTAQCKVTVKNAPTSVKTNPTSVTLSKGETYTISESTNSGSYANATNLKWSTTNSSVATVTKGNGNKATITAKSKGTAYIKITLYNGKTAQCKVTVK